MILQIPADRIKNFSNAFNSRALFLLDRDENFPYWLKSYSLPQITSNVDTIQLQQHPITIEPTTLTYEDFSCTVYVDEFFLVYKNLHEWLVLSTPNPNFQSSKTNGTLFILDNSYKEIVAQFRFYDIVVKNLPGFSYDNHGSTIITLDLVLPFSNFEPTFFKE